MTSAIKVVVLTAVILAGVPAIASDLIIVNPGDPTWVEPPDPGETCGRVIDPTFVAAEDDDPDEPCAKVIDPTFVGPIEGAGRAIPPSDPAWAIPGGDPTW